MATLLCAGALGAVGHSAFAANDVWIGNTDANFATLANWTGSVTPNGNTPVFGVAGTAGATLNNNIAGATYTGFTFNSGASAYTISGNSFTLSGGITNSSTSLQTINNAITLSNTTHTFAATSGNITLGGAFSGTTQTLIFSGSGTTTLSGTNTFNTKGANFSAFQVGGAGLTTPGNVTITGSTIVDGTGFTDYRGYLDVHAASTLTIQSGGSLSINTSTGSGLNSGIGNNATGTSTLLINGGSFSLNGNGGFMLGNNRSDATGVLTISSGTATITAGSATLQNALNFIAMGRDGATGIVNLDGGTLATGRQFVRDGSSGGTAGSGTATFNFNGGVLQAQANQTQGNGWFETATTGNFQVVTTTVKAGGAKIDTNGFTTNVNTVLAHDSGLGGTADGGLTKSGTGTLSLGAANTFTGATVVNAGTLALGASGSISNSASIAIKAGATFNTTAQSFTMLSAQPITFTLDPSGAGSAGLLAAGALNITNGAVDFSALGTLDDASYVIATYSSLTGSSFGGGISNLPSGYTLDYNFGGTNNTIALVAVPEPHEFAIAIVALLGVMVFIRRRNHQS
jgi:autotransporter-associated beta strand protein